MNHSDSAPVVLRFDEGIAWVTFNRPDAMNALDVPTVVAFHEICKALAGMQDLRVVVLRGEGKNFGVGGDLSALRHDSSATAATLIEHMHGGIKLLTGLHAPVIASLHGNVMGGSFSLSLACDLAIAAEGTRFNLSYAKVAASCDVAGSWSLPRIVGLRNAMQIALLSDTFDATEALRLGLINQIVPADQIQEASRKLALRLATGPTLAYGQIKRLMRQSLETDFPAQIDAERSAFLACTATNDFKEAMAAFFAKRSAVFTGT